MAQLTPRKSRKTPAPVENDDANTTPQKLSPRKFGKIAEQQDLRSILLLVTVFLVILFFCDPSSGTTKSLFLQNPSNSSLRSTKSTSNEPFDWSDVQVSQNAKGKCGADKCFWRSISDPDSVGYLVGRAKYNYQPMKKAYDFAVNVLEDKCNGKHLLLESPQRVQVTPDFIKKLISLQHNDQEEFALEKGKRKEKKFNKVFKEKDHHVVVQKVRVASQPNLMFGFMQNKWEMMVEEDLPRFRSQLQANGISLRDIEVKLEAERKSIECAMEYSKTYFYDLQGLIDLQGNYFHMDIDSQFWVEIGDENDVETKKSGVIRMNEAKSYKRSQNMIWKFNEMIQRLVHPPPEGVDELPAWRED